MSRMRRFDPLRFRAVCRGAGFTTESLAARAGVSSGYLAHVRIGLVPGEDIRRRVAAALGVTESELWPVAKETEAA